MGRDLDVAVVTDGPGLPGSLDCTHLLDEHLMVAVGRGHRFARRRAVFLREVIGDTFVTGSDTRYSTRVPSPANQSLLHVFTIARASFS